MYFKSTQPHANHDNNTRDNNYNKNIYCPSSSE